MQDSLVFSENGCFHAGWCSPYMNVLEDIFDTFLCGACGHRVGSIGADHANQLR